MTCDATHPPESLVDSRTGVRSDDDRVQVVPNSKFVSNKISNLSRRRHRSIRKSFHLNYEDLPKCGAIVTALREKLKSMPDAVHESNSRGASPQPLDHGLHAIDATPGASPQPLIMAARHRRDTCSTA